MCGRLQVREQSRPKQDPAHKDSRESACQNAHERVCLLSKGNTIVTETMQANNSRDLGSSSIWIAKANAKQHLRDIVYPSWGPIFWPFLIYIYN